MVVFVSLLPMLEKLPVSTFLIFLVEKSSQLPPLARNPPLLLLARL